ncbi:transcription factor DIVARICATA [Nicotiana tabacum]|uniref:Transcription factor DIVARICATA n=2 Tax=Nicotiana TaxID=4085 RepID=A0A1S4AFU1_TOBAC|nr:PREDICTED: transcription factor DIVARICATA-like [Nicotiana sylvestris]XP_016475542.1 PREDICTED: transcription factor DIVARICATA-like [Nicotiana tabacum]
METLSPTSLIPNSSWMMMEQRKSSEWTQEENKKFESALAIYDETTPNRWFKVADLIPGKTVYDVMKQYKELAADVSDIEAGLFPVPPTYFTSSFMLDLVDDHHHRGVQSFKKRGRCYDQERKKGVPWTEEEHRRFLMGLDKHGKGDWRNISRNFVISKTPTQVASHAQKYYLRQLSGGKDKRRPSIHDITTVNLTNIDLSDNNLNSSNNNKSLSSFAVNNPFQNSNDGALMAFGSSYNRSSYPYELGSVLSRGRYGTDNISASDNSQIQRYQIWG